MIQATSGRDITYCFFERDLYSSHKATAEQQQTIWCCCLVTNIFAYFPFVDHVSFGEVLSPTKVFFEPECGTIDI